TFNLNSSQTRHIQYMLALSELPLTADLANFNLTVSLTGTLTFGVDLNTRDFFLRDDGSSPELTVTATLAANNFSGSGGVNSLTVELANGSAQLNATGVIQVTDPSGDHRLTTSDFAGGPGTIASLATYSLGGSVSTSVGIASSLAGLPQQ